MGKYASTYKPSNRMHEGITMKSPVVWRITEFSGNIRYIEHDMIITLLGDYVQKDIHSTISEIGHRFRAMDVRPLYDMDAPKETMGRL